MASIAYGDATAESMVVAKINWTFVVGLPPVVVSLFTLVTSYVIGRLRPIKIKVPRYWWEADSTRFSCSVKNRSYFGDVIIGGLPFLLVPRWWRRLTGWRHAPQLATLVPYGGDVSKMVAEGIKLTKREERSVTGELRDSDGPGRLTVPRRVRVQAQAGSKRSRRRKLRHLSFPPS